MKNGILFIACLLATYACMAQNITQYPGGKWEPGPARYKTIVEDDIPVKMDDGVTLMASIAYPADLTTGQKTTETFPVVIEHTPYVRFGNPVSPITYFAERGYIVAVVRVRGAGKSEGEVDLMGPRDKQDCQNLINWAAKLKGSDGRVAFIGASYPAGMAFNAAGGQKNPALKAVVCANNGLESVKRQAWMVGGIPTTGFTNYNFFGRTLFGNTDAAIRFFDRMNNSVMSGGEVAYNGAFWNDKIPMTMAENIVKNDVPVLLWAGYFDILDVITFRTYVAFQNAYANRSIHAPMLLNQKTSPKYQLIMGGWDHGAGLDVGIYLQWLDTWVKGLETGIEKTNTPLHLFEGGTNRWVNAASIPLVANNTPLYLNKSLSMSSQKPSVSGEEKLVWGDSTTTGSINFKTAPFEKGATIGGSISATIYASSSNTNLQLLATLFDVAPDGKETEMTHGVILGSQRKLDDVKSWKDKNGVVTFPWQTLEKDEFLTPNQIYKLDIDLSVRQWGLQPNHYLRLELRTQPPKSICPTVGLPPVNGCLPCRLTKPQQETLPGGVYKIVFSKMYPSAINIPQLPFMALPTVRAAKTPTQWNEGARSLTTEHNYELPLDWGKSQN